VWRSVHCWFVTDVSERCISSIFEGQDKEEEEEEEEKENFLVI